MKKTIILATLFLMACDPNSEPTYGEGGYPRNCRALIKENITGFKNHAFSCEDALNSIERNCGEFGLAWGE